MSCCWEEFRKRRDLVQSRRVLASERRVRDFATLTGRQFAWITFLIVTNVSSLDTAFGYYTRDTEGFSGDVYVRNEQLRDVGVMMMTSHHVVLYTKDRTALIVPSADVLKI